MDGKLAILAIFFLAFGLVSSLERIKLSSVCSTQLSYDYQRPISIENTATNIPPNKCKFTINSTRVSRTLNNFLIRIDLNKNTSDNTLIRIMDHGLDMKANNSLLNTTSLIEAFKEKNFVQIESFCFEIALIDDTTSSNNIFQSIKSITITAINSTSKSSF